MLNSINVNRIEKNAQDSIDMNAILSCAFFLLMNYVMLFRMVSMYFTLRYAHYYFKEGVE